MRWPWMVCAATLIADQLTKHLIRRTFIPGESHPVLDPVLYLTYVQNTGSAFGLLKEYTLVVILFSLAVIGYLAWELLKANSGEGIARLGAALVLGGALGNLIDRLRFGFVVDFIDLRVWPVFNVGDSAISVGVGLLIWHSIIDRKPER